MRRFPSWKVSEQVPVELKTSSNIVRKTSKVSRVVPLLTEKSQSVCWRRVEPVCMGKGGRFGRGVWCGRNKTNLHWSEAQIVSDKDAAKRAARALLISGELPEERGREAVNRWLFAGSLHWLRAQFPLRTAAMLLPPGTLLLLAALYSSVDLTGAEVSGWSIYTTLWGALTYFSAEKHQLEPKVRQFLRATFRHSAAASDFRLCSGVQAKHAHM